MKRREFIKTIGAASMMVAAPIAVIPEQKAAELSASEFLLIKPSISDALMIEMQERTILDLMQSVGIPSKYLDKYNWND